MHTLKLGIVMMLATNIVLLGMEASKAPEPRPGAAPDPSRTAIILPDIVLRSELPEPPAPEQFCFTIGPFEADTTAEAVAGLLQSHHYSGLVRETEAFVDRGYWVYLPPFGNEPAARGTLQQLHDAGLEDVALMRNGDWNLSISLGYFIEQSNALARRDHLRAMGFPAEMRIQREDEARYWVDYQRPLTAQATAESLLDGLVPAELHREIACSAADRPGSEVVVDVSVTPVLH